MISLHELPTNLGVLREINRPLFEQTAEAERKTGEPVSWYRSEYLREAAVDFGLYAIAIDHDDVAATGYFKLAAACALSALTAPRAEAPVSAREIRVSVDPVTLGTELESISPTPAGYGSARMSVVDFENALYTLFAFGDDDALQTVGRIPEKEYRSSGIVQSERNWLATKAEKHLALGQEKEARKIYDRIFDATMLPLYRERIIGLRALWAEDERAFRKSLERLLKLHRAKFAKRPGAMVGFICFPGMIAARLAFRKGIVIEDQNYLPLRFSPWYRR